MSEDETVAEFLRDLDRLLRRILIGAAIAALGLPLVWWALA